MPRIVIGSVDELIEMALDDMEARSFFKRMGELRKKRVSGWYQQYQKLSSKFEEYLSHRWFFVPLPPKGDGRPRKQFAVHYYAKIAEERYANSWDFASVPGGDNMSEEEVVNYIEGLIDGAYGVGFFKNNIKAVIPVSSERSLVKVVIPDGSENTDDLFED